MRVSEVGEFRLIERLARLVGGRPAPGSLPQQPGVAVGIGDDAAVWSISPDSLQVATTDALVEGVHFDLSTTSWRDLGWKALAVNVSDIAAMGAIPRYALVTLGLTREQSASDLDELYGGMQEHCLAYGLAVVGGDVVSSPCTFLSVTVVGEGQEPLLRRSAGQPGDKLAVTGWLGSSAGGLRVLQGGRGPNSDAAGELVQAHVRPTPRVREARALAAAGVRCGMDLSDGLLGDTTRICEASDLTATLWIDSMPAQPALKELFPDSWRDLALAGGEDYELLCAIDPASAEQVQTTFEQATGLPLTLVGELRAPGMEPRVRVVDASGADFEPCLPSWDHFRVGG